jgi:CubicO group peptidase (beta-lactamase class C family)
MGIANLETRLDELARRHQVVGASLAVLADGEVHTAACGLGNIGTGVRVTTDTVFQIGSITKVYTTSLVLQLVDEGKVDLDQPVADLVDEFTLADGDAVRRITVRHLLNHTSGIEGDHFVDLGRGEDAVAKYVETLGELRLNHPVGATMSYCNTGFVLAGRLVEKVTGLPWRQALYERLLAPAGLNATVTLPEDALRFRVAYGHVVEDGTPRLAPMWQLPASMGPAGSAPCATASDVVGFARLHLASGVAEDGTRVLSESAVAAMRRPEVEVPNRWSMGSRWGLGWTLFDWDGRHVCGHDGSTMGQNAYLRVVPDAGVAVALLTNGGHTEDLYRDLYRELLADLCDIAMPEPPTPPADLLQVDLDRHVGTYERVGVRIEVGAGDGRLLAAFTPTGSFAAAIGAQTEERVLVPVAEDVFVTREDGTEAWLPAVFYSLQDGSPYLHFGLRATPKVG